MEKVILGAVASLLLPIVAHAAPVDLTGWTENGYKGTNAGRWTVQPGNDSVKQSINGQPTVFFEPGSNAQGTSLSGTIEVQTTSDDDFIGFFLGYQDGELNSTNADFWLVDWKQATQGAGDGVGKVGLSLSHVTGDIANEPIASASFWSHSNIVNEVQRATNLGSTGWADNTLYTFDLTFTEDLIEVFVDGTKEISYAGSFNDGAFGFYNYSQRLVEYAGITEDVLPPKTTPSPIPLPASLPLLLAGIGALGLQRRRKKA